jgi:hypothetical protein
MQTPVMALTASSTALPSILLPLPHRVERRLVLGRTLVVGALQDLVERRKSTPVGTGQLLADEPLDPGRISFRACALDRVLDIAPVTVQSGRAARR